MAPSAVDVEVAAETPIVTKSVEKALPTRTIPQSTGAKNTLAAPLKIAPDSPLRAYEQFDSTVPVGTEFPRGSVQLVDLLRAPNSDELIRDLAVLIAERGVVFFRAQHITPADQRELVQRLGELSGKPATSKLHIHPFTPEGANLGDEIFPITSGEREKLVTSVKIVNPFPQRKSFDPDNRASSRWVSSSFSSWPLQILWLLTLLSTLTFRTNLSPATIPP